MGGCCIVEACKSEYYPDCGLSFHRFPKTEALREKWSSIIGDTGKRKIGKNSVVCSRHFKPEDYVSYLSHRSLKANAVPSLFLSPASIKIETISIQLQLPSGEGSSEEGSTEEEWSEEEPIPIPIPIRIEAPESPPTEHCKEVGVQTMKTPNCKELRHKIKVLNQKLRRRDIRIKQLKNILSLIKKKCRNVDEVRNMLENNCEDLMLDIDT